MLCGGIGGRGWRVRRLVIQRKQLRVEPHHCSGRVVEKGVVLLCALSLNVIHLRALVAEQLVVEPLVAGQLVVEPLVAEQLVVEPYDLLPSAYTCEPLRQQLSHNVSQWWTQCVSLVSMDAVCFLICLFRSPSFYLFDHPDTKYT